MNKVLLIDHNKTWINIEEYLKSKDQEDLKLKRERRNNRKELFSLCRNVKHQETTNAIKGKTGKNNWHYIWQRAA